MVRKITLRQAGGSIGATLPKDMADRVHVKPGDEIFAVDTENGILLTPYDPTFEKAMAAYDEGLLEPALARPVNFWSYDQDVDLAALAAEYGFVLAKNHAFLDGNKRIGFVAANVFLLLNGFEIEASEPEVVHIMLSVANGSLGRDDLAEWIRTSIRFTE
jgi:death on curing protein